MKLRGWHIAGFGTLRDWRQDDLADGLTVFYGPNEAGKSTLLAFLRFAFFGFRSGNTKDPKYPPPPGLRHGGAVLLEVGPHLEGDGANEQGIELEKTRELSAQLESTPGSDAQIIKVDRTANAGRNGKRLRIELPNGEEAPESELGRMLGHADRDLYNNVFAFSLSELQSIESLTDKGVQDHIFSAGITGAGRSARDALDQIQKESDQLFKGKARTRVNSLVEEIAKIDEAVRDAREQARNYPRLSERERELAQEHETVRVEIDARRLAGVRARKLMELWRELHGPMLANQKQLEALADVSGFGPDPRTRFDSIGQEADRIATTRANVERELATIESRLERLVADPAAIAVREEVLSLERDLGLYENQCRDLLPASERLVDEQEAGVQEALSNLGPDWNEEGLRDFHFRVANASEASRFGERLDGSRQNLRELEVKIRNGNERVGELEQARTRQIEERDAREAPTPAELDQWAAQLGRLRTGLAKRSALEVQLESFRNAGPPQDDNGSTPRVARWASIAVAGLGVAFVVGSVAIQGAPSQLDTSFFLILTIAALGGLAWLGSRSPVSTDSGTRLGRDALSRELEGISAETSELMNQLEVAFETEAVGIEALEASFERARRARVEFDQQNRQLALTETDLAAASTLLDAATTAKQTATEEHKQLEADWQIWATTAGLPTDLAPRDVALFAGEVKSAKDHQAARDKAASAKADLETATSAWRERAVRALADAGEVEVAGPSDPESSANLTAAFLKLVDRVREASSRDQQRPEVEGEREQLMNRMGEIETEEERVQTALLELFAEVTAIDRDDYLAKLALHEQRCELENKVRQQDEELERRLGLGEEAESLRGELETGRVTVWESTADAVDAELPGLQEKRDELLRSHRDVENEMGELQASNDLGALELKRATLQQDLVEDVARWRELQVARGLIERTLERFERERQPAVLQEASHHFAKVTGGRYPQIVQTAELGGFSVVDAMGERKPLDELSRGTAEQLYVCIRLGLIAEFCRRAGRLPVAMDDVLVNFDDRRALEMVEVLDDFSRRNRCQVLVFTCNSRTRDLFAKAAPDALQREFEAPAFPGGE